MQVSDSEYCGCIKLYTYTHIVLPLSQLPGLCENMGFFFLFKHWCVMIHLSHAAITVGLEQTQFTATEMDGAFIEVCAIVLSPEMLEREAVVTLQSADGSATC